MGNYRLQTSNSIGGEIACSTCATQLTLCYSSTSYELCCGQPAAAVVFIPSNKTFATATDLFTSDAMTTKAPVGFYSDDQPTACGVSCAQYTQGGSDTGNAVYINCTGGTSTSPTYDGTGSSGYDEESFCASSIVSYTGSEPMITGVC
jgi:hypothetical protein